MKKKIVIVGGGISGLLAALLVSEEFNGSEVVLVEKSKDLGGLLKAFDYGVFGKFDYGMHNLLETGNAELDQLIFSLLDESEWHILEGEKRDLAGLYFNGKLQTNSPYVDLRFLDTEIQKRCIADFFLGLGNNEPDVSNARMFVRSRFGAAISDLVISPIIKKLYGKEADEMAVMATMITPLGRVVLFDQDVIEDLTRSSLLRDRIAYTEQRDLPLERSSGKRGFYPYQYGIYRLIDAFKSRLTGNGVQLLTGVNILALHCEESKIKRMSIDCDGHQQDITNIEMVVWSAGLPQLAILLGLQKVLKKLSYDPPKKTIIVNILLDSLPLMGDLYYFYCYDEPYKTFRVTNYSAYCPTAKRNGGYPICVEMLVDENNAGNLDVLAEEAIRELRAFQVLGNANVIFSRAECLESGFPMPSSNNINGMDQVRDGINALGIKNLLTIGILSEENLFFQGDVLLDAYCKIKGERP